MANPVQHWFYVGQVGNLRPIGNRPAQGNHHLPTVTQSYRAANVRERFSTHGQIHHG